MRSKEEARDDLWERFGMAKTADFQAALIDGRIAEAEEWLDYIVKHKKDFPQYRQTWESWLVDRKREIEVAKSGRVFEKPTRTKEKAKRELLKRFGFDDTAGFRACLARGDLELATRWLEFIEADPGGFPQYLLTRDFWLADRKSELEKARTK